MRVNWVVFKTGSNLVEAQVFEPEKTPSRDVILFCPGFPGMGAALFEQRHAAALVESGYTLIVLRHNGMRMDGPHAPLMINNAARLMQAHKEGVMHLGGGPSTIELWLAEPLTALHAIHQDFDNITVIGNSFGALSSLWSMTEQGAPVSKIRHIILLAGAQGIHTGTDGPDDVMRIWKPEFISVPRITDKVTLGLPDDTIQGIKRVYVELPDRVSRLTPAIPLTYLVVMQDELLKLSDTEQFRAAIGNRGNIVKNDIDRAYPEYGFLAHDMPDYPTENLLNLIRV